jgi:hypothetical protein
MAGRSFIIREGATHGRKHPDFEKIALSRASRYGTTSSLLNGVARVACCFRISGIRGVATEITNALSLQIKERHRPAPPGIRSGAQNPGACSWVSGTGEWTNADLTITDSDLAAFMSEARFPRFCYQGSGRVRYALWHQIGFALCNLTRDSVVVDMGAGMGIWGRMARRQFGCTVWDVDCRYPPGFGEHRIGAPAGRIPLPSNSVTHVVSFCSFNCFEGPADTEFLWESYRLLKPGGKLVIVPLCICDDHVNLFDPSLFTDFAAFDPGAHQTPWPGWGNRFGRWYDREAFRQRLILRGPVYQRIIVHVDHDLHLPGLAPDYFAALFIKPSECS